ncbi:MAG: protein kinase domain-containing protein [Gemmataceae bacterium]
MSSTHDVEAEDPRLVQAAREYLAVLEAGRAPDRDAYFALYPDLAAELTECFDNIDFAHAAARQIRPAGAVTVPELPANPLGDFQVVRQIGRGGMGVVYEAVQRSLGRRVALKVLPFAAALDAKHLQRFRTEAHAAAQLNHPNIVPVYAVGSERGIHFYAMQLIEGRSLNALIRELRGEAVISGQDNSIATVDLRRDPDRAGRKRGRSDRPARPPESYREAADFVAQVADALDYAHEAGVIHRDIKPANLLLDANDNVWVTDFGLAQMGADATLTASGDVVGTLRYMSPEQASGKRLLVDHRTDVYSLGATLYELLTLEPIFPDVLQPELLHQILNEEPRRPRAIDPGVPVDLETIVLKAIGKMPEDRYATAGEFAADIRRFLADEPVRARRPSPADRARKWLRRHPVYVNAAGVLLLFGMVGLAASSALVLWKQKQTDRAYQREKDRAREAEDRFRLAKRSADEMIRIANEDLTDNPDQQRVRRQLLEAAVRFYEEFIELRRNDPGAQAELEATRAQVEAVLADVVAIRGAERHMLLSESAVQDELRLSADQRARVNAVVRDIVDHPQGFRRGQTSQLLLREMKAHEAQIVAILTPAQFNRLKQIALQTHGAHAFREPEVVAKLQLTAEQRQQIRDMDFRPPEGPGGGGRPHPGPGPRQPGPPERDGRSELNRVVELLTSEQKASWHELVGETFNWPAAAFRRGPARPFERPDH